MNDLNTGRADSVLIVDFEHRGHQKQQALLVHLENMLIDLGDRKLGVEVVVYGLGLAMLVQAQSGYSQQVHQLQAKGAVFSACSNAMAAQGVNSGDLLDGTIVVPSGVGRIVQEQLDGAIYFKA